LNHLASAPFCATLAELSLAENEGLSGEQGGAALAALANAAPRLRRLDARSTGLGDEGVRAALVGGLLRRLVEAVEEENEEEEAVLDLSSTGLAAEGCDALSAALLQLSPSPPSSRRRPLLALRLGHNRAIPPEAVARLASACQGELVGELDIGGAALDAEAVRALAAAPGLRHLSLFSCAGLKNDEATVKALCEALASDSSFATLEHLGLAACGLDAPSLKSLLESATAASSSSSSSSRLRCLELGGNPGVQDALFETSVAEARERRPELDVAWRAGADGADGGGGAGRGAPPPVPGLPPPQLLQQQPPAP
jgi:hypothetical protein